MQAEFDDVVISIGDFVIFDWFEVVDANGVVIDVVVDVVEDVE